MISRTREFVISKSLLGRRFAFQTGPEVKEICLLRAEKANEGNKRIAENPEPAERRDFIFS